MKLSKAMMAISIFAFVESVIFAIPGNASERVFEQSCLISMNKSSQKVKMKFAEGSDFKIYLLDVNSADSQKLLPAWGAFFPLSLSLSSLADLEKRFSAEQSYRAPLFQREKLSTVKIYRSSINNHPYYFQMTSKNLFSRRAWQQIYVNPYSIEDRVDQIKFRGKGTIELESWEISLIDYFAIREKEDPLFKLLPLDRKTAKNSTTKALISCL